MSECVCVLGDRLSGLISPKKTCLLCIYGERWTQYTHLWWRHVPLNTLHSLKPQQKRLHMKIALSVYNQRGSLVNKGLFMDLVNW